jgi:hypothetical protein
MIRALIDGTRAATARSPLSQRLFSRLPSNSPSWLTSLRGTRFWRHQVKKRIAALMRLVTDWALFTLVVLTGGLSSAYIMMDRGSTLTTLTSGPWTMWTATARPDADPYTRAHHARLGALPLPADIAETWVARTDGMGDTLHSSCDYELVVTPPATSWWSLAVFDADGRLIENATERYVFTSDTAAISPDGRFVALLSRSAGGGNWLPTSGAGNLSVVYTLIDMSVALGTGTEPADLATRVPQITAKSCR